MKHLATGEFQYIGKWLDAKRTEGWEFWDTHVGLCVKPSGGGTAMHYGQHVMGVELHRRLEDADA